MMLPLEIFELFIDELGSSKDFRSSRKALQSFSLTSRSFLTRSRYHLFSDIQIVWTKDTPIANVIRQIQNLRNVLQENSTLISYIRAFEVSVDRDGVVAQPESGLPAIIDMLHSHKPSTVYRRDFKLAGNVDFPTLWLDLSIQFRLSIFRLMASCNGPVNFRISSFAAFPVTLITHCTPSLRKVTLDRVWFAKEDPVLPDRNDKRPDTSLVTLDANDSLCRFASLLPLALPSSITVLSSLKHLGVYVVQSQDVTSTHEILKLASMSLESLEIGGKITPQDTFLVDLCNGIDLASIPHLRHVSLQMCAPLKRWSTKPIPCPIALLDELKLEHAASASLETIHIKLQVGVRSSSLELLAGHMDNNLHEWELITNAQGLLPALREIRMDMSVSVGYGRDGFGGSAVREELQCVRSQLEKHIQESFSGLRGSLATSFISSVDVSPHLLIW